MLTWTEAQLFLRFGEDMRYADWPSTDFVRYVTGIPQIHGFIGAPYTPSGAELTEQKWVRA